MFAHSTMGGSTHDEGSAWAVLESAPINSSSCPQRQAGVFQRTFSPPCFMKAMLNLPDRRKWSRYLHTGACTKRPTLQAFAFQVAMHQVAMH